MPTVCLFDIDGTLLNSGGAGQDAMELALLDAFALGGPYTDIAAAGRTDKAITTDLFLHHGLEPDDHNWNRFLSAYLHFLPRSLARKDGVILPGVVELLEKLHQRDDVLLGLLTGNLQVGAQIKLRHYKLDHYFRFGGFGDLHHNRDDVARLAFNAAAEIIADARQTHQFWVIGDTPADVQCGRAIGAKVLAVATGIHSRQELAATEPDLLCDSLQDVEFIFETLTR